MIVDCIIKTMSRAVIIMENTQSRVLKVSSKDFFVLRNTVLWFDKKIYAMSNAWVKKNKPEKFKQYLIDEDGFFPSGIIHRVKDFLERKGYFVDVIDNRIVPEKHKLRFRMRCSEPTAYDDQTRCTKALMGGASGIASVPTGVGKTRIMKDLVQFNGLRSLIITPSTALKEQAAEYLEDCFGSDMVGIYDKRFDAKPITILNYHSVGKTDPRVWEDFDLVGIDEFHNSTNNTFRTLNQTHLNSFFYRYGLTATNFASQSDDIILLESVLSNTVFSMSIKEAIHKGYIRPVIPIFYNLPNKHLKSEEDYRQDYKVFMDDNYEKNELITELMAKMRSQGVPSLTLVKHIEHGKHLAQNGATFLNGQDAKAKQNQAHIERFNALEIQEIVGTSVIGEGVDTKACGAVINAKGGKSEKELLQNIGRCVRNFPNKEVGFYFDFIDNGQKNLKAHSRLRMRVIEREFGIKPKIIDL